MVIFSLADPIGKTLGYLDLGTTVFQMVNSEDKLEVNFGDLFTSYSAGTAPPVEGMWLFMKLAKKIEIASLNQPGKMYEHFFKAYTKYNEGLLI